MILPLHRRSLLMSLALIGPAAAGLARAEPSAQAAPAAMDAATETGLDRAYGAAMHGSPAYPEGFTHFAYTDPAAAKGGSLNLATLSNFDSLNPFIVRGDPAPGAALLFQPLMEESADEAFTKYGHLAESISFLADRSQVEFHLRPQARWHDGAPLTAEDVIWSLNTLREQGAPFWRAYYANVARTESDGPQHVRFVFDSPGNRELPLILGQLLVLPKHWWQGRDFSRTLTEPPLGSGPYRIASVSFGNRITYERVPDWWGADLPVNRGQYNFDRISFTVFRDVIPARQAFFAGDLDYWTENTANDWATGYDVPAVRAGRILKQEVPNALPQGMQGFLLNLRRPQFQDIRVRQALGLAFDFDSLNRQVAFGSYTRSYSYFSNSELAATGLPSPAELALLEPLRGRIPDSVFTTEPGPIPTGRDRLRQNLQQADQLLKAAGWTIENGRRVKDGQPLRMEFLEDQTAFDRWILPYVETLKRLGIEASLRIVDAPAMTRRLDSRDFDVTVGTFGQSLSPGNEQREFWGSKAADEEGSRNVLGLKDPAVDSLIETLIFARSREDLITACRALDRVLISLHLLVPQWHYPFWRIAHWDKFGKPAVVPKYDPGLFTWWVDPAKAAAIGRPR